MNLLMMVPFQYSSFAKQETHEGFQDLAGNNPIEILYYLRPSLFLSRISIARWLCRILNKAALEYTNGGSTTLMAAHPNTHMDN